MKRNIKKIFVGLSGGVDSSVAALLLQKQGYDVTGVFLRCFNIDGCAERDAEDARRVAEHLGIPFYVFDFEEEYKQKVVQDMVDGYAKGITPNPDVMCNKEIKFGLFLEKALSLGADYIATGHYIRIRRSTGTLPASDCLRGDAQVLVTCGKAPAALATSHHLLVAKDKNKDQSYFLWTLTQNQLKHCLFPIGDYLKSEVREIARKAGLPTADKKDSQGICFLGKVTLVEFLSQYIPERRGAVVTTAGEKIGEHRGAEFYTVGQRHIGVAGKAPIYVAGKDIKTNTLVVAEDEEDPALYRKEIGLRDVNFVNPDSRFKIEDLRVFARIRYRQPLAEARLVTSNQESVTRNNQKKNLVTSYELRFTTSQKAVAPGQSVVFYSKEDEMLGGGIIQ